MTMTAAPTPTAPTPTAPTPTRAPTASRERADLLETLGKSRHFLRYTLRGLTDEQANQHTTVSALTLGGLIKHVTAVERGWARFIVDGPQALAGPSTEDWDGVDTDAWADGFRMIDGETVETLLAAYAQVAAITDELVATVPDLDADHPLPVAPWFEPGARWSARRALVHIIAETAQHAGHADIIRESLDGAKTMG
jgi:hypothetical protein